MKQWRLGNKEKSDKNKKIRVLGSQNRRRSDCLLDSFLAKFARLHTCTRILDCSFWDCALRLGRCFDALPSIIRLCWYTVAITRLCRRLGQNSPPKTVQWCSSKQHWADHKRNFKMSNESGLSRYRLLGWGGSSLPRFCNQFNFQDNSFLLIHRCWKSFSAMID